MAPAKANGRPTAAGVFRCASWQLGLHSARGKTFYAALNWRAACPAGVMRLPFAADNRGRSVRRQRLVSGLSTMLQTEDV